MFIVRNNIAIALVPKCANTSIRSAFGASGKRMSCDEAMAVPRRVFFMREPFERLKSDFRFFNWLYDVGSEYSGVESIKLNKEILSSWDSWTDYILTHPDVHWMPQVEQLKTSDGEFAPNILHKLDDIDKLWGEYFPGLIPTENETVKTEIKNLDYRINDINEYYAEDYKVWHGVI